MKTGRLLILIILLSMLFVQGANASEVLYELLPGTLYEEGCVAPCMCPVWISNEVEGTFTLTQTEPDQGYMVYQISQISWNVMGFNELLNHQISGQGMYRLG